MKKAQMIKLLLILVLALKANLLIAAPVLWVVDGNGYLGTVNLETADVTIVGYMNDATTDIAFDPDGNLYAITRADFYSVNKTTAEMTHIGELNEGGNSLVFGSVGSLYTASNSLYTIDISTGQSTEIGRGGYPYTSSGDLAFVDGNLLLSDSEGDDSLVKVNTSNGEGALIGDIGFWNVFGLASPNGVDLYGVSRFEVISIDPTTGVGTSILDYSGSGLVDGYGAAFITEAALVPIPAAVWLFGSGLLGLVGIARRKKTA